MKDNSIYDEQINLFLKGKMSADEEQQFKAEIMRNPDLKQQVREHLYLIRGIKQVKSQEEKNLLVNNEQHSQNTTPLRRNWIKITSIAASIAVILVLTGIEGSRLYYRHEVRQYAYNASVEVMSDFAAASRSATSEEEKNQLMKLFRNAQEGKDLPNTIAELSKLYVLTKDDYVDIEDDYAYQIGWFLAVAHICNGNYKKASNILDELRMAYPDNKHIITIRQKL